MGKHDPAMVSRIVFIAALIANIAVSYEMKLDVERVVPKEEFPKAAFRGDWRPQRWLLSKHREYYPDDVLPQVASGLNALVLVAFVCMIVFTVHPLAT
jgi:hypothetical protein